MSTACPECHVHSPVRLENGQVCAACRSREVWSRWEEGGVKLVIDHAAIAEAEARRRATAASDPWWRRAALIAPAVASVALGGLSVWCVVRLLAPRRIGPASLLFADLQSSSARAALCGLLCFAAGLAALLWARRGRHFRRFARIASHLVGIVLGAAAALMGGISYLGSRGGFGTDHLAMPERRALASASPHLERIADATAVILAPDGDGDARGAAMGTGSVIGVGPHRAFVMTCSHVAMPYAPVATWRDPATAHRVWVELSDGRSAEGRVVWTARPPLDVALIEVAIEGPPEPVQISPDEGAVLEGQPVFFVPNPYRHGWIVHHGAVVKRERHATPAGVFSLLFTDLPVQHGDSGSGLFDAFGRLVGLNTWTRMGPEGPQGISLPSNAMQAIASMVKNGQIERLDQVLSEEHLSGGL